MTEQEEQHATILFRLRPFYLRSVCICMLGVNIKCPLENTISIWLCCCPKREERSFLGGNYEDCCHIQLLQSLAVLSFPPGLRDESLNIRQRMVTRTCMNVCVFLHVRLLMEPLAAVLARVWPRVRMDEEVC